jgi:hypothetical protein
MAKEVARLRTELERLQGQPCAPMLPDFSALRETSADPPALQNGGDSQGGQP